MGRLRASVGGRRALPYHVRYVLQRFTALSSNIYLLPRAPVPSPACWARGLNHGWKRSWGGRRNVNRNKQDNLLLQQQLILYPHPTYHPLKVPTVQDILPMVHHLEQRLLRSPLRLLLRHRRPLHRQHTFIMSQLSVDQVQQYDAAFQNPWFQSWFAQHHLLDHDVE